MRKPRRARLAPSTCSRRRTCAIADCGLVVGTSARQRHLPWELVEPRACAERIVQASRTGDVAVVFGAERTGLTNLELERCNLLVTIPTSAQYSSLNLAMAS